jgi:hypothetical protein
VPMLWKALHLSSAGGMLVRERALNFGHTRCVASASRGLCVRGLPVERSSKVKVSIGRAKRTSERPAPVLLADFDYSAATKFPSDRR